MKISPTTEENLKNAPKTPTNQLKKHINKIITVNNTEIGSIKPTKITEGYKPGYIYGKIKTHKLGNPIRPIISQIPTPVYYVSKILNNIIVPYFPNKYSIKSTHEFIQILNSNPTPTNA